MVQASLKEEFTRSAELYKMIFEKHIYNIRNVFIMLELAYNNQILIISFNGD